MYRLEISLCSAFANITTTTTINTNHQMHTIPHPSLCNSFIPFLKDSHK